MKQLEETHQKALVNYLRLNNIVHFAAINETPWKKYVPKKAYFAMMKLFKDMGMNSGVSDLLIYLPNKLLHIELKIDDNKQSEAQINWENSLKQFEYCEYHVCYSYQEAIALVESKLLNHS